MAWTSEGKIKVEEEGNELVVALLYNFDIGGFYLKSRHKAWLDSHVLARFQDRTVHVGTLGWASNSGDLEWNKTVARRRAESIINYLLSQGFPGAAFEWFDATVDPDPDDDPNDEEWRGATILVSTKSFTGASA